MADLSCKLGDITLKNPVLTASGTYGYGDELNGFLDVSQLGGIVTKSLTYEPRLGNPPPRTCETASGMLNSIGLANVGVKRFVKEKLPLYRTIGTSVFVSVAGSTTREYCDIVSAIEEAHGSFDGYEINISCPNVDKGGLTIGTNADLSHEVIASVRRLTDKFIIAKLTPNSSIIGRIAKSVEEAGADSVSLINTLVGMAVDVRTRKPKLGNVTGGLSGPCVKPVAIAQVYEVSRSVSIPVIGMGGIETAEDVIEFILAGATAVQVGTFNFYNPLGIISIIDDLTRFCEEEKIGNPQEIRGMVWSNFEKSTIAEK